MQCSAVIPDASRHLSRFGKKKRNVCCNSFSLGAGGRPCGCLFSLSLPAHVYIRSGGLFLFSLCVCVCRRRYIWISCVKQLESIYLLRRISLSPLQKNNQTFLLMRYWPGLSLGAANRITNWNERISEDLAAQQEKKDVSGWRDTTYNSTRSPIPARDLFFFFLQQFDYLFFFFWKA